MDESLHELEGELANLRLRRLSSRLIDEVASELAAPLDGRTADTGRSWRPAFAFNAGWMAGLAAAVVLSLAIFTWWKSKLSLHGQTTGRSAVFPASQPSLKDPAKIPAIGDGYKPVAAANVLYDLKDEGLVTTHTGASAHRVRYRYLDTYTWKNPRTNALLKWSVPRDEIRIVPLSFN